MRFAKRGADGALRSPAGSSRPRLVHTALVCGALAVLLSACGGGASQPRAAEGRLESGAPTASEATEPRESAEDEAQAAVDAALARMAHIRQLKPKAPVKAQHLSPQELVQQVEKSLDEHVPPRALLGTGEMLFGLGTVPHDFNYRASLLALMGTELAGLYDPEQKVMFLRGDLQEDALEATLFHELIHALQDQHYGLGRVLEWREDSTDELSALSGLAEGDATSAMLDAMISETGQLAYQLPSELVEAQMRLMAGSSPDASIPAILKRSVVAPYLDGLRFVNAVRAQDGWAGVDRVWSRPPVTTEQLLHVDKYAAAEPARDVPLPPPPPGSALPWELLFHDVWGEQSLRLLFEEWMPTRSAATSATGWGGDRIVLFGAGERRAVAWHVVADTSDAAEQMHLAFLRGVFADPWTGDPRHLPQISEEEARKRAAQKAPCRERADAGPWLTERKNTSVVVIAGMYRKTSSEPASVANCQQARAWAHAILAQASQTP